MEKICKPKEVRNFDDTGGLTLKKILTMARFTVFCFSLGLMQVMAVESYSQQTRLSFELRNESLENVLRKIEKESEFFFLYNKDLIDVEQKVDVSANNQLIKGILDELLKESDIRYAIFDRQIVLSNQEVISEMTAQQKSVSGKVFDSKGLPLPGVSVVVKGTTSGTITDANGGYTLTNVPDNAILQFSFVGMRKQEVVVGNQTSVDVVMQEEFIGIDEVVAIGYGTMKKSDLTGSVSSVSSSIISKPSSNFVNSIQGTMAGVTITQNSALPNASPAIRIRGINSISASSYPLTIVDGVPGDINTINPNDIESLTVLKDASACAIYGSRASNGVIIITTKRGKGKPIISYNAYYGIKQASKLLDFMKPEKYFYYRQKNCEYAGMESDPANVFHSSEELLNYQLGRTTDWQDLVFRNAAVSENNLSISGSEKSLNYFLSASYRDHDHIAGNYKFRRASIRSNVDKEFNGWLKIGNNLSITKSKNSGSDGSFWNVTLLNPYTTPTDPDGNVYIWPIKSYTDYVKNPLTYENAIMKSDETQIDENIYAKIKFPIQGLDYKISYGIRLNNRASNSFSGVNTAEGYYVNGLASKVSSNSTYWLLENIINYNKNLGKHSLLFTGLYSAEESSSQSLSASSSNFVNDVLTYNNLSTGALYYPPWSDASRTALQSIMGRFQYGFNDRYLMTLTVRRDGYSAFGKNRKYGNFPSAAIAWRIEQEDFMKKLPFISQLKLRLSYGKNGNQAISPYSSQAKVSTSVPYSFGSSSTAVYGFLPVTIANSKLGWETTTSSNIGLDFGLFKDRITGTVEFYQAKTSDILLTRGIPFTTGFSSIYDNIGKTQNDGIEFAINSVNFNNEKGFQWTTNLNVSYNKNKIVDLYGDKKDDLGNAWFIGKPVHVLYNYVFDGIWQESDDIANSVMPKAKPGDVRLKDISGPNGIPDGQINALDREVVGHTDPDYIWGFINTFQYKGFDFSFFLQGVLGVTGQATIVGQGAVDWTPMLDLPYWLPETPSNRYPTGIRKRDATYNNTAYFFSRDYVRLKDLTLGYTFPTAVLQKIGVDKIRLYVNATNLLTFTDWPDYDPESGSNPMEKSYNFGISVSF